MDTPHRPEPMKNPDTHSPAYLEAKKNRIPFLRRSIRQFTQHLMDIEEEEYGKLEAPEDQKESR